MHLDNLSLVNFKNYESADLQLSAKLNCFVGPNGQGKTNVLDAVYYLAFCKSFLNPIDRQNIRFDTDFLVVQGDFYKDDQKFNVYCGIKKNQKKVFKKNKKEYDKLSDHIGSFPLVIIAPTDVDLIKEGSDLRRKFLDGIRAQYDHGYLENLIAYNRVLQQRNALLKYFAKERTYSSDQLEVWSDQLIPLGEKIHKDRIELVQELEPVFKKYYKQISGEQEEVGLLYVSHLADTDFKIGLDQSVQEDIRRQFTTVGIHKDDVVFTIHNQPMKKFGSQGQQKSFLIALKLAQLDFLKAHTGVDPILLLDDIFDKLDQHRVKHLLRLVHSKEFGQIFLTDTDNERVLRLMNELEVEHKVFEVNKGTIEEIHD